MRKCVITLTCLLLGILVTQARAQAFKIGGHGGYAFGGDMEDGGVAYGGQMVLEANDYLSLELAGSRYSDKDKTFHDKMYTTGFLLTPRLSLPILDILFPYVGGGVGYYLFDVPSDTYAEDGYEVQVSVDNQFGYHLCAGLNIALLKFFEIFAEYRWVFVRPEAKATFSSGGQDVLSEKSSADYNHGVARVGLNLVF